MNTGFVGTPETRMNTEVAQSRMDPGFEGDLESRMDTGFGLRDPANSHEYCICETRKPAWLLDFKTRRIAKRYTGALGAAKYNGRKQ